MEDSLLDKTKKEIKIDLMGEPEVLFGVLYSEHAVRASVVALKTLFPKEEERLTKESLSLVSFIRNSVQSDIVDLIGRLDFAITKNELDELKTEASQIKARCQHIEPNSLEESNLLSNESWTVR